MRSNNTTFVLDDGTLGAGSPRRRLRLQRSSRLSVGLLGRRTTLLLLIRLLLLCSLGSSRRTLDFLWNGLRHQWIQQCFFLQSFYSRQLRDRLPLQCLCRFCSWSFGV